MSRRRVRGTHGAGRCVRDRGTGGGTTHDAPGPVRPLFAGRRRAARLRALVCVVLALAGTASASATDAADPVAAARDEIWALEQAIYRGRSEGSLDAYLARVDAAYLGWPPGAPAPTGAGPLRVLARAMVGQDQERLSMELVDFTLAGDTAVIFYRTHRTRMPDGAAADQRYAICHVWRREGPEWRMLAAMGRALAGAAAGAR